LKQTTLSLICVALLGSPLAAITLPPINVVAAQGMELELQETPDSVSVITKTAIEASRVTTLQEALNRLGNVTMVTNGGPGQNSSFLLRGFDSKRVLVLIDGVRYNDVTGLSGAQFNLLSLHNIERIEIIKGSQSAIWGADASAGVINIVTQRPKEGFQADATIEYGSFASTLAQLDLSYKKESFDVSASVSDLRSDGFSATEPTRASSDYGTRGDELGLEDDAYENRSYAFKAGINLSERDRLEATYRLIDAYVEYDAAAGVDALNMDDPFGYGTSAYYSNLENRFYTLSYSRKDSINDLKVQWSSSTFERDQFGGYEGSVEELSVQDTIGYHENSFVRFGASYQQFEHTKNAGSDFDRSYDATALFVTNYNTLELFGSDTILSESIRYDRYNDFDNKLTAKIGLKHYFDKNLFVALNGGTGYNVPTLYQLHDAWSGNPQLDPETTTSVDLRFGTDILNATLFYNKINDMIDYDFASYAFANFEGSSVLKGVEIEYMDMLSEQVDLRLNYTYLDTKNSDGKALASRPEHQIDATLGYAHNDALDASLHAQYIGERFDNAGKLGAQTGEYLLLNATMNYRINPHFTLYGTMANMTDEYYQVRDGYATPKRSYTVGLTARY